VTEGDEAEAELVERARGGDREAFAMLVAHHQQPLGGYLFHLLGDRELALDLTQDTFVRAYTALSATRPGLAIRAWLFRIATNLAYDVLRRRRRIAWLPLAVVETRIASQDAAPTEEQELVRLALGSLRPEEQVVLVLCTIEQHTLGQVAATLSTSPDAVRKRLSRAKERFRQAYAELSREVAAQPNA
jgi:RNA polymerase sigma-70 factor (ECF subfamily)